MKKNQEQRKQAQSTDSTKPEQTSSFARTLFSKNAPVTPPTQTMNLEDKTDLERKEAYIEPKTREFLRNLLELGDETEIIPVYNSTYGFIYQVPNAEKKNESDVVSFELLDRLAKLDILKKDFYDSVSACYNCESILLTFHSLCPKCKSHHIEKTSLTEHIPCGFIEQKNKYVDNRCPNCEELLVEGQYRNMGRWYICQNCSDKFENPEFDLICHNCDRTFTIKESQVREIPKFSLNQKRKKETRQNVASLEDIGGIIQGLGFSIEMPGLALGLKSGMQHHFSLIGKKTIGTQEVILALDHATSESEVQTSPIILYIYKTSEVKVDIPIFVAMPQLNETARKIAQGHNILLIEGSTEQKEILTCIKTEIEKRINEKTIDQQPKVEAPKPESSGTSGSFFNKVGTIGGRIKIKRKSTEKDTDN